MQIDHIDHYILTRRQHSDWVTDMRDYESTHVADVGGFIEKIFPDDMFDFDVADLCGRLLKRSDLVGKSKKWKLPRTTKSNPQRAEIALFFNEVGEAIRKLTGATRAATLWKPRHANGQNTRDLPDSKRKPDVYLVEISEDQRESWGLVMAVLKLKTWDEHGPQNVLAEMCRYARWVFMTQSHRRYILGASLVNDFLRLGLWSRSGVIASQKFNIHKKPELFVRVVAGFLFADLERLGVDTSSLWTINVNEDKYEMIKRIDGKICGLPGRGTTCYLVRDVKDGKEYVVKDAWVDDSQAIKEYEIMEEVRGCEYVAELVQYECMRADGTAHFYEYLVEECETEDGRKERWQTDEK